MTAARAYNAENPNLQMLYLDKEKIGMTIGHMLTKGQKETLPIVSKSRQGSPQVVFNLSPSRPQAVPK